MPSTIIDYLGRQILCRGIICKRSDYAGWIGGRQQLSNAVVGEIGIRCTCAYGRILNLRELSRAAIVGVDCRIAIAIGCILDLIPGRIIGKTTRDIRKS